MSRLLFVSEGAYKHDVAAAKHGADSHGLHLKITSTHGVRRPESKRVRAVKTDCRVIRQQAWRIGGKRMAKCAIKCARWKWKRATRYEIKVGYGTAKRVSIRSAET